jgi:hypothetical protein
MKTRYEVHYTVDGVPFCWDNILSKKQADWMAERVAKDRFVKNIQVIEVAAR